jgi:hypothetical protein
MIQTNSRLASASVKRVTAFATWMLEHNPYLEFEIGTVKPLSTWMHPSHDDVPPIDTEDLANLATVLSLFAQMTYPRW